MKTFGIETVNAGNLPAEKTLQKAPWKTGENFCRASARRASEISAGCFVIVARSTHARVVSPCPRSPPGAPRKTVHSRESRYRRIFRVI